MFILVSKEQAMAENTVEASLRGTCVKVPVRDINGRTVAVTGRWIRISSIHDEDWLENELEDPELYINRLKEQGSWDFKADIFTFAQRLPETKPRYPYPMEWNNVAAICLNSPKDWWENKLPQETRKNVRRSAKRGVITKVTQFNDDLVRGILEIYRESPIRQGIPFWHYRKGFDAVKRENATYLDRSTFIGAYYKDELIGFMKIVYVGKVAAMMQFLSKISHYDKRPTNALIAKAVEHCAKKGVSYLTYGKYTYGNKEKSTLTEFKRRNGFEEFRVPRYYVPLTAKGKMCIALKLHRDLVGILPERLIYPLWSLRRMWYKLAASRKPV